MIRSYSEYRRALARITEYHLEIVDRQDHLRKSGCRDEQGDETLCNLRSRCQTLHEETAVYERCTNATWVPAI